MIQKRGLVKRGTTKNDIYVKANSRLASHLKSIKKLLNSTAHITQSIGSNPTTTEVTIHGLGHAIQKAVELALLVQRQFPLKMEIETSTETLLDDVLSQDLDGESSVLERLNSSIHIKLKL